MVSVLLAGPERMKSKRRRPGAEIVEGITAGSRVQALGQQLRG